jgi:hypothetical protein
MSGYVYRCDKYRLISDINSQTDIQIAHPDVVFYDFYGAWDEPIESDVERYLSKSRRASLSLSH